MVCKESRPASLPKSSGRTLNHCRSNSSSLIPPAPSRSPAISPSSSGDVRLDLVKRARWLVDVEMPIDRDFIADLGLVIVHPGIRYMGQNFARNISVNVAPEGFKPAGRWAFPARSPRVGAAPCRAAREYSRCPLALCQAPVGPLLSRQISASWSRSPTSREDCLPDLSRDFEAGALRGLLHIGLERLPVHVTPVAFERREHGADGLLLLPPRRDLAFGCCRVLPLLSMSPY